MVANDGLTSSRCSRTSCWLRWTLSFHCQCIRCETLWLHCLRIQYIYYWVKKCEHYVSELQNNQILPWDTYELSKSRRKKKSASGRAARRPVRTPPPACGFPTQSWQLQSYPLANPQLKPLRTSTSRLDHSESSENRCLLSKSGTLELTFSIGFWDGMILNYV